jgi:Putative esterase
MRKSQDHPVGTVTTLHVDSQAITNNVLGDPSRRRVDIYVPAGHDGTDLPLLVDLVGFTGGGPAHTNWKSFGENAPERLDRLIGSGAMKPCVVAFPDCFTRLGGNQYINSAAMGNWADFLIEEMLPAVETDYNCGGDGRRGCFGKSSGGYGAMVHALLYPDVWAGAACMSGDMGFELMFATDFAVALRALARHDGSIKTFMDKLEANPKPSGDDIHVLMALAMCATYDPDPDAYLGIQLPVTTDTCELIPERWANFMKWDPLEMLDAHAEGLKKLKALWIECGDIDQYNLAYGARRMTKRLTEMGVSHEYREFPDNHSSIDYRLDEVLPFLADRLS